MYSMERKNEAAAIRIEPQHTRIWLVNYLQLHLQQLVKNLNSGLLCPHPPSLKLPHTAFPCSSWTL